MIYRPKCWHCGGDIHPLDVNHAANCPMRLFRHTTTNNDKEA